ncbi:MAG: MerR family transcriptional regulator [Acidimicrobiales bacterium]
MTVHLTIGEFSKMTYLSVKALRHYHDVGLLEPAEIDPSSGYRHYTADQVATAQAIRRFRDLDMPLEQVRTVLRAPDLTTRNQAILDHLATMQEQLERTQHTVASLQELLSTPTAPRPVDYRTLPDTTALAIEEAIAFEDSDWIDAAFVELHATLDRVGITPSGPDSALYSEAFFTEGVGLVVTFIPVSTDSLLLEAKAPQGRTRTIDLPETRVAVMLHDGPFDDLDKTYGALGTVVSELGLGADGPIREIYVADDQAEVCWPVRSS